MEREQMVFDVLIVGAGPSGLACAIKLAQLSNAKQLDLSICVIEKGSEVGAHILSGAVFEPSALNELLPQWQSMDSPITTQVKEDFIYLCRNELSAIKIPNLFVPKTMMNHGNYIVSMGNVCRWLAEQAEGLGVEIFPGFAAASAIIEEGVVRGVVTGDMGLDENNQAKDSYMPGMELRAKQTIFAEGCRGHIGKQLISRFKLDEGVDPQHYAIGFKEVWDIPPEQHNLGRVVHGAGWPLSDATGGSYMYHADNNQIYIGLIVDLNYKNPHLNPFAEFQKMKHHPIFASVLEGGSRVSYGARAIAKGGLHSLPKTTMPGAMLVGCDVGTLNGAKIKGNHTAMKSGMLAAEHVIESILNKTDADHEYSSENFDKKLQASWLYKELKSARNFSAAIHKWGNTLGGAFNTIDQNIFSGSLPLDLHEPQADYKALQLAKDAYKIEYPRPDNKLSFDRLSSVFLSNTNHEEDQPSHLVLASKSIPITRHLADYDEPAQRYCPAGVYEIMEDDNGPFLQVNSQNCIHCKTCDIKDPSQNITWVTPEGGGGPNYPNM
ncbi:electron transfer flavoprotein-ubiquinone oxidoreductase [Aliiglaciecola lipolytica]|uniref:Electron transfer flavoprotein-ubiquinone oxidoreductase n=1 Tax=Aliiglaciecola lipolytica E3 TaxID=1127673 RepID=K6Y715_9ALTE|nr:electron transfer flavoprotein-ubiquinone oxidoreductase [Aliiglaciecola lipolytica]GAC14012.1 electron-transferring-flavoprotein dehydrogenase [Aliiglaciecola lipolytica E3]